MSHRAITLIPTTVSIPHPDNRQASFLRALSMLVERNKQGSCDGKEQRRKATVGVFKAYLDDQFYLWNRVSCTID